MFSKIYALLMFNVLDYFFTTKWLQLGYEEANPWLNHLFITNNSTAVTTIKLLIVPLLCFILYIISQFRKNTKTMNIFIDVLLIIYSFVTGIHIYIMLLEGVFVW